MRKWFGRRETDERDLDDEIQFHLAEETRMRIEDGEDPESARVSARRVFGNVALVAEVTRDMWGRRMPATLGQDLRYGIRLLVRNRVFAVFSIVSLALGIGGTSAVFSLYHAIVLRELPVSAPDRLVTLAIHSTRLGSNSFMPYPQFAAMQERNRSLEGIFARSVIHRLNVGVGGTTAIAAGLAVTGGYHGTLGLQPASGRLLTPDDDRAGHAAVAVLSHSYWQRRFGGSPSVVGDIVSLNQVPFTIVGVEPAGFYGVSIGAAQDVIIPMRALVLLNSREPAWDHASATWIEVMGRLRPGVGLESAAGELDGIFRQVSADAASGAAPDSDGSRFAREIHVRVASGATGGVSGLRNRYAQGLRLLMMLLGGVLCLASLNVAALLLSRAEARKREIVTRLALGASRGRIVRQLLTESAITAFCGGALGLLLAWRGSETLLRLAMPNDGALPLDLAPDARVVAFTCAVSMASCLIFGLLPAARATSWSGRELGGGGRRLLDRTLVIAQTAVAVVLVVCAGLFLRSLQNLWTQATGYDRRNVLMFSIDAELIGVRGRPALEMYGRVLEELRSIPGVRSATVSTVRPVSDNYYFIDVVSALNDRVLTREASIRVAVNHLGPGYFETLGIPLRAGRDFDSRDTLEAPNVAIVSEQLARHFTGNPVGERLTMGKSVHEIVGVAADTRYARVTDAPRAVVFLPFFQGMPRFTPTFEIKYSGSAADTLRAVGEVVGRVDSRLAVFRTKTLDLQTEESFARERLLALLTTYFGGFAWLLAGVGLYGLLACTVTQRTREFGLRVALGARPDRIAWTMMRESAATVVAGIVLGLGCAVAIVRLLRSQLFGLEPADPAALAGAVLALLALTLFASIIPTRRALRIDPMTALRHE